MFQDVQFLKSIALPAAAATANTASLDLGTAVPGPISSALLIRIEVPATPPLANAKNITFNLQHSADNATFVTVPCTGNMVVTGAGGAGAAAAKFDFFLPPQIKRYIRASAAEDAAGGDCTALSFTLSGLI